ncbi:MAG: hypothetical protein Q9187_001705 [Circinaria calcarea]
MILAVDLALAYSFPKSVAAMFNMVVLLLVGFLAAVGQSRHPHHIPPKYDFQQRNLDTIQRIYNAAIFPNNQAFIRKGVSEIPKGLFNENARGRIAPVGNFSGIEDTAEYFFALNPAPVFPLYATWTNAKIVSFSSGCPEVASSVVYGATTGVNPNASTYGKTVTTIKQVGPILQAWEQLARAVFPELRGLKELGIEIANATKVHCSHVGPTGGGKCVDVLYNDVYFDDEELFGAPPGETFMCRNLTGG